MQLVFSYGTLLSSNFLEIIHEALLDHRSENINVMVKSSPKKKYPMILNTYQLNDNTLVSVFNNEKYTLTFTSLLSLLARYNLTVSNIDLALINTIVRNTKEDNQVEKVEREESKSKSESESQDTHQVRIPKEKNKNMIDYLEYSKKYRDGGQDSDDENEDKKDDKPPKTEAELKEEQEAIQKIQDERAKKRELELKNRFLSEKDFTYKQIYNDFFVEKKIKDWDKLPELFKNKFVIYLYMDGKGTDGKERHERLLDRENEFTIFKHLMSVLNNDNYDLPDNEKYVDILTDFIDSLPPIEFISDEQIMKLLNDPDDELFERENTSPKSGDDPEDKSGNATYGHFKK